MPEPNHSSIQLSINLSIIRKLPAKMLLFMLVSKEIPLRAVKKTKRRAVVACFCASPPLFPLFRALVVAAVFHLFSGRRASLPAFSPCLFFAQAGCRGRGAGFSWVFCWDIGKFLGSLPHVCLRSSGTISKTITNRIRLRLLIVWPDDY